MRPCNTILPCLGFLLVVGCASHRRSLVHLYFPPTYEPLFTSDIIRTRGAISTYMDEGLHTLRFSKGTLNYAAVIDIQSGGELYVDITEEALRPIVEAKEKK